MMIIEKEVETESQGENPAPMDSDRPPLPAKQQVADVPVTPSSATSSAAGRNLNSSQAEQPFVGGRAQYPEDQQTTLGRKLAMILKNKYSWYNPQLLLSYQEQKDAPSLEEAWEFFEHVTLERYVVPKEEVEQQQEKACGAHAGDDENNNCHQERTDRKTKVLQTFHRGDRALNIAKPGETTVPTKLYPVLTTPLSQLGDFGLGYGLYFSTLRAFAVLAVLAGILNIPNIVYYASDEYSKGQPGVPTLLKGSAICTDQTWVPCPTCTPEQFESKGAYTTIRDTYSFHGAYADQGGDWLNVTDQMLQDDEDGLFYFDMERMYLDHYIWFYWNEGLVEVNDSYNFTYTDDLLNCEYEGYGRCFFHIGALGFAGDTSMNQKLGFALKNNCDGATLRQGFINYTTMLFLILGVLAIRTRQNRLETAFDLDEQTAQDYSIAILNPPKDANDPDEWKQFFESKFEDCKVAVCSVDVANDVLVKHLVERRELKRKLELAIPPESSMENELRREQELRGEGTENGKKKKKKKKKCRVSRLIDEIDESASKIREELAEKKGAPTSKVFVTFETESAQRRVLKTMTVGTLVSHTNDTSKIDSSYLFRGERVLEVVEPEEPSTIRWQELNATKTEMMMRLVLTSFATLVLIFLAVVAIMGLYASQQMFLAGLLTTIFTIVFPILAKFLAGFEQHHSETTLQKWLFIKIAGFNVFVTTILISLVTPFVATLDNKDAGESGLITPVHNLFFSQLLLTPAIQLLDIGGNISRHILAPRAKTQEEMNMCMMGTEVLLAERYANLIKYLFLILWYSSLYPAGMWTGSLALFIVYFSDRFSLMRSWARTPQLGTEISDFARNYFTPTAIAFMAIVSAYFWSGFPFDDLCEDDDSELHPYYYYPNGKWSIDLEAVEYKLLGQTVYTSGRTRTATLDVRNGDQAYKFCKQDLRFMSGRSFPALPRFQPEGFEWMTEDQETVVAVYGWTSVFVLAFVMSTFAIHFSRWVLHLFQNTYSPTGEDMGISFSEAWAIEGYVPQVHSKLFPFPLLLCDTEDIDTGILNWRDPEKPYSFYDISKDILDVSGEDSDLSPSSFFSKVRHWPSPKSKSGDSSSQKA